MRSQVLRPLGVVAAGIALSVGATACAESEASPSASTVTIQPSSYVTKPVVTTSSTVPGTTPDGRSPVEQIYTVKSGDYPARIAALYDVEIEALLNYNGIVASEFPYPGETLKIPPNAKIPGAADTTATEPDPPATGAATTTTVAGSGDACAPGTYTIEADDVPLRVARKFDVTIEALNEANAATAGYNAFYVGLEIVIPPKGDC